MSGYAKGLIISVLTLAVVATAVVTPTHVPFYVQSLEKVGSDSDGSTLPTAPVGDSRLET